MLLPQIVQILDLKLGQMKTELKQELIGTLQEMLVPLKEELNGKIEAMKTPLKEDLIGTFEEMKIPMKTEIKEELSGTVEAMKAPLKSELQESFERQIVSTSTSIVRDIIVPDLSNKVDKLKDEVMNDLRPVVAEMNATPDLDGIVTASSTIINQVLVPQMEEKVTSKVNQVKEVVKDELKTELDQDLKAEMTQQITSKIIERQEEVDGKVIFAVARKTSIESGTITFDTVIANIGDSMNNSTGTFTTRRSGLYLFTFSALTTDAAEGGFLQVQVHKNNSLELLLEDGRTDMIYGNRNVAYSWMLQLSQGDTISLKIISGTNFTGLHGCGEDWIHFNGQLLNAN